MEEKSEMRVVSLAIFGIASILLILGLIFPVIEFNDAIASLTNYEDGTVTLFDRLTGLGVGLYVVGLVFALLATFWSYNGKSALIFGLLAGIALAIPSIAVMSISDITDYDPDAAVTLFGTGILIAMILCFVGGFVSRFVKK